MTKNGGWPSTQFGNRLRVLRANAGLSQKQLAERAQCNVFTVAKLERGTQEPAWPLVLALADALGVTCLAFVEGTGSEDSAPIRRGRPRNATAKRKRRGPP